MSYSRGPFDDQGALLAVSARPSGSAPLEVFVALLRRDFSVTLREFPIAIGQVIIQPLFLLFVFGKILPELGYAPKAYADLLFPGIVALTVFLTAVQSTSLPLVIELSYTMEIEDRLLAPMPTALVAVEKVMFAAVRAMVAGAVLVPIGILILGSVPWRWSAMPIAAAIIILGAITGASMGLILGTIVPPNRINTMFALVLTPLMFTGSSQYPWLSLRHLRWFQILSAFNPLTYVSEGLRGAMVPTVPHLEPGVCLAILVGFVMAGLWIGIRGFTRRAIG